MRNNSTWPLLALALALPLAASARLVVGRQNPPPLPTDDGEATVQLRAASQKVKKVAAQVAGQSRELEQLYVQLMAELQDLIKKREQTAQEAKEIESGKRSAPPTVSATEYHSRVGAWKQKRDQGAAILVRAKPGTIILKRYITFENVRLIQWRDQYGHLPAYKTLQKMTDYGQQKLDEFENVSRSYGGMDSPPAYPHVPPVGPSGPVVDVINWKPPPQSVQPNRTYLTSAEVVNRHKTATLEVEVGINVVYQPVEKRATLWCWCASKGYHRLRS